MYKGNIVYYIQWSTIQSRVKGNLAVCNNTDSEDIMLSEIKSEKCNYWEMQKISMWNL